MAKKILNTLRIDRFRVDVNLINDQICGNGEKGSFEVSVELVSRGLGPDGFVIEVQKLQDEVQEAFGIGWFKASCEELANGVVHIAHRSVGRLLVKATARVYNRTGHVTATWESGMAAPTFPRMATAAEIDKTSRDRRRPNYKASSC